MKKFVCGQSRCAWIAIVLLGLCLTPSVRAIETAGTLFVDLNAATFTTGDLLWENQTDEYTDFEPVGTPTGGFIETTPAVFFDGASAFFGLDAAPEGLTGLDPTRSIEVWALNPTIDQEETLVAWGHRGGPDGTNMSFNYGFRGEWGAVGHWGGGGPDIGWIDNNWTAGAPEANKWHHLVYTFDGEVTRVYSDGELWNEEDVVTTFGISLDTYQNPAIAIASQWDDDVNLTAGIRGNLAIGRVRIHDDVLTPAQILSNYNEERASYVDPGGGTVLVPENLPAGPVHRYSFAGNADDSVGGADGVLVDNTGNSIWDNGQLTLGNTGAENSNADNGDYVDLPNGIISALGNDATFETWTTWGGPTPGWWQRIFDFGTSNQGEDLSSGGDASTYAFLTPYGGNTSLRFGYRYGPDMAERIMDDIAGLPIGEEKHITVVWNGDEGTTTMYVDGKQVAENDLHFALDEMDDNNNWLGRSQWADAMYVGSYNEFRIYDYALTDNQVYGNFLAGADTVNTGGGVRGDFNGNGEIDLEDIDLLTAASASGTDPQEFDLTGDGLVDGADVSEWAKAKDIGYTWIGDADFNGEFSTGDFVKVLGIGKYEQAGATAVWSEGDWNGDGVFGTGDLVAALSDGGYEEGPRTDVSAVPEPSAIVLSLLGLAGLVGLSRRRR